jgi:hypothetical protein
MNLFLDTSFIRSIARGSLAERALQRVVDENNVIIHVSILVEMELASHLVDRGNHVPSCASEVVRNRLNELRAVRHSFGAVDAGDVFELYFAGAPPFGSRKSRNDLPDGFIFVAIRALADSGVGPIDVIASDRRLRRACEQLKNVTAHADISNLMSGISPAVAAWDIRQICKEKFYELEWEIAAHLKDNLCQGFELSGPDGQIEDLRVTGAEEVNFDWADAEALESDVLSIPFGISAEATISYPDVRDAAAEGPGRRRTSDVTLAIEGWVDAKARLAGRDSIERLDVRIMSVDVEA